MKDVVTVTTVVLLTVVLGTVAVAITVDAVAVAAWIFRRVHADRRTDRNPH